MQNEELMQEETISLIEETGGEYLRQLEELKKLEVGSDEYEKAIKGITAIGKLAIELDKQGFDCDAETRKQAREDEKLKLEKEKFEHDQKQAEANLKQQMVETGVKAATGIVVPMIGWKVFGKNLIKVLKFEELGTVTSQAGKSFLGKIFPKFF